MVYLIVFLAAVGTAVLLWCLTGLLLYPVFGPEMVTYCRVEGDGETMEHCVRAYGWLRDCRREGGRLVLVDCGLSESGRKAAELLCGRHGWLDYRTAEAAKIMFEKSEDL